jgi:hypothetical protein
MGPTQTKDGFKAANGATQPALIRDGFKAWPNHSLSEKASRFQLTEQPNLPLSETALKQRGPTIPYQRKL